MKRRFLAFVVMLLTFIFSGTALAAIPGISGNRYIKMFGLSTANNTPVYTNARLDQRGTASPFKAYNATVYASDEIYVLAMNDSYALISYPVSNGRRQGYVSTSSLTSNNFSKGAMKSRRQITTYRRPGSTSYGYISNGDDVWTVARQGDYTQVVYPTGNTYKMAWISNSDYNNYIASSTPQPNPQPSPQSDRIYTPSKGDYYLIPESNSGFALDVRGGGDAPEQTSIWLYNKNDSDAQIFTLENVDNGWYIIKHKRTGRVVNVQWGGNSNGTKLWLYRNDGTASCQWRFLDQGNGSYIIQSKLATMPIMEVQNNNVYTGAVIQLWQRHSGQAGRWKLVPAVGGQNVVSTQLRYPLNDIYVCGNDWMTKYSKRPSRPYHAGIDVHSSSGDKTVYAAAAGTVAAAGWNNENGNFVIIQHTISGRQIYSFYCHMSTCLVSKGIGVKCGTPIGIIGNTGRAVDKKGSTNPSAGEHLHFTFVDKLMPSGGYWGYVTSTGNAVYYEGYTFYSPAFVIDNQRLP